MTNSSNSTRSFKANLTGALAGPALLVAFAPLHVAHAGSPTPADELLIDEKISIGGSGGLAVTENPATYQAGPITAIRVCHGDRLDSLTVTYGLKEGKKIGGHGGVCDDVPITNGQKVTAVRLRQGSWIDAIAFQIDGAWTEYYGGGGGIERTHRADGGGALAYIEGRVGDKIDQLTFAFGLPYLIKDVKYDRQAIKDQLALSPIERIGWQCFNNSTSVEQEVDKKFSQTVTEKASWDFQTTTEWGIQAEYSFGVEGIGEASYSASFGQSFAESKGTETSNEKNLTDSIKTKVPSGTKIQTKFVASKKALNIPFTYTMAHYRNGNRSDIVQKKTFSGMFEGVTYTNDNASWEPVQQCEAGSPLEELGTPEEQQAALNNPPQRPEATPAPQQPEATPGAVLVSYVETSRGAVYSLADNGDWHELSAAGKISFTFEEMERDEDCVYLFDASRNVLIVLNITRNVVQYARGLESDPRDLYSISMAR